LPLSRGVRDLSLSRGARDPPLSRLVRDLPLSRLVRDLPLSRRARDLPLSRRARADWPWAWIGWTSVLFQEAEKTGFSNQHFLTHGGVGNGARCLERATATSMWPRPAQQEPCQAGRWCGTCTHPAERCSVGRGEPLVRMSALVLSSGGVGAPPLEADLMQAGIEVRGETDCPNLLQDVIRKKTDLVVCFQQSPEPAFFAAIARVAAAAPCPVVVFTMDPDAEKMATATRSGVHAYVVAGYGGGRLRSVVQLAGARFRHEQSLRQELAEISRRFDERKLVDRAKGILMGARQLREDEAFRALRSAAMASKQRIGQVSQVVIDSAHYAEAVNRTGQLRMLSQRIVKFYALACTGVTDATMQGTFADSIALVDGNLAILDRSLSKATFGDLLGAVIEPWRKLQAAVRRPPAVSRLADVDGFAEQVLEQAETLTANLEVAAFAPGLHAINVAGRQRMLTQRLAKEILMASIPGAGVGPGAVAGAAPGAGGTTFEQFVAGLDYLDRLPLTNADIQAELQATHLAWQAFRDDLAERTMPAGRARIVEQSDVLLGHFERLTGLIERGIHALMGV
jgi:AmiR/NasT family two-component response regulator